MTDTRDRREAPDAAEGLPAAYRRILPLHVLSEVYGLEGLRHRLVLEIEQFPTDQQEMLHRALALAERLHAQDRRSREPYMHHILRVTIRIANRCRVRDLDVLVAALLHDAIEDHAAELAGGASRRSAAKYAPLVPAFRRLVTMPDTPLGEPAKTHILGQLDQAEERFAAVLHG